MQRFRRAALAGGASFTLLMLGAAGASAHVHVTPSTTDAGEYSVLSFAFSHGCDGSPTTQVEIEIPEQILAVSPTVNPGWDVETVEEAIDGADAERVSKVVYTAKTPVDDGLRDTLDLELQLPDEPGKSLTFPVVQTCEEGEHAWVETAESGEPEPESPAPFIELTAASEDASEDGTDAGGIAGWAGLVLGALGLAAGGTALARTRRS